MHNVPLTRQPGLLGAHAPWRRRSAPRRFYPILRTSESYSVVHSTLMTNDEIFDLYSDYLISRVYSDLFKGRSRTTAIAGEMQD